MEHVREWVGGRFSLPAWVEDDEPYRPDAILWVEMPRGVIVLGDVVDPRKPVSFADSLQKAMAAPIVGCPRRPSREPGSPTPRGGALRRCEAPRGARARRVRLRQGRFWRSQASTCRKYSGTSRTADWRPSYTRAASISSYSWTRRLRSPVQAAIRAAN